MAAYVLEHPDGYISHPEIVSDFTSAFYARFTASGTADPNTLTLHPRYMFYRQFDGSGNYIALWIRDSNGNWGFNA